MTRKSRLHAVDDEEAVPSGEWITHFRSGDLLALDTAVPSDCPGAGAHLGV